VNEGLFRSLAKPVKPVRSTSIPIRKLHKLAQQLNLERVARVGVDAHVGFYDDECPPLGFVRSRYAGRKVNGEPRAASLIRLMRSRYAGRFHRTVGCINVSQVPYQQPILKSCH
jgi:hypothetical protein